jgi:carboxypeptidase C (cathepsin A)
MAFTTDRRGSPRNDEQVNTQLYFFLQRFFALHTRFAHNSRSRRIFLTGESHAGHYIPSFAAYVLRLQSSSNPTANVIELDIAGLAIGNGWVYPLVQYDVSDLAHGFGLISHQQRAALKAKEELCQAGLRAGTWDYGPCYHLLDDVLAAASGRNGRSINMYDVRQYLRRKNEFPRGHEAVEAYMNKQAVRSALHAEATPHRCRIEMFPSLFLIILFTLQI